MADLEEELLLNYKLSGSTTKRSTLIPVGADTSSTNGSIPTLSADNKSACFQTPAAKRIGNITISTIRKSNLIDMSQQRTPLKRLGPSTSPIKIASSIAMRPASESQEVDKENICPKASHNFGGQFCPSPLGGRLNSLQFGAPEPKLVDWDALDSIIKQSTVHRAPASNYGRAPNGGGNLQSEADEIESLLFSQDPIFDGPDIFLGYDDLGASETESLFRSNRPRSASMVSVQTVRSLPSRNKIEVKVRSCKRELPAIKLGSQLRKMILPGECVPTKRKSCHSGDYDQSSDFEEPLEPKEYSSFKAKLHADEPVESDFSDDDFKVDEEPAEDEDIREPLIPQYEIEGLFEDSKDLSSILLNSPEEIPSWEKLQQKLKAQVRKHYVFLVQMLAICGEVRGAEDNTIVMVKMLSQLVETLPKELLPIGIHEGLDLLLRTVHDPVMRSSLVKISKTDPLLRPKSTIKSLPSFLFKCGTPEDPYRVSEAYTGMLSIFKVFPSPEEAFNFTRSVLVDNNSEEIVSKERRNEAFLAAEDALLLVGLKRFGLGNWEMIHARFLPTRTSKQIYVRYKNLISRRAPMNSIKKFVEELWRPLSKAEEALIYRGVMKFGKDFKRISSHYLPHRPATILRNLWEKMDEIRRQSDASLAKAADEAMESENKL